MAIRTCIASPHRRKHTTNRETVNTRPAIHALGDTKPMRLFSSHLRAARPALVMGLAMAVAPIAIGTTNDWFGIHLVDEITGRGVPLVELETVNHLRFVSDSAGP